MAPPVLMFMNMKGGVGKTTLAVELSRTLAHACDKHVLLIDYDPQANASLAFFDAATYSNRDCPDQTDSSNHVTLWDGSNYKRAA